MGLSTSSALRSWSCLRLVCWSHLNAWLTWMKRTPRSANRRAIRLRTANGCGRADGDEARQVLIFSSQTIQNPRAHAGPNLVFRAGVQLHNRLPVRLAVCVQAADDAEIIRKVGHLGKQAADLDAAVAMLFELPRRREQFARRHRDAFSRGSRNGFIPVAREQR